MGLELSAHRQIRQVHRHVGYFGYFWLLLAGVWFYLACCMGPRIRHIKLCQGFGHAATTGASTKGAKSEVSVVNGSPVGTGIMMDHGGLKGRQGGNGIVLLKESQENLYQRPESL
jgi:hypothetical protein